MKTLYLVIPCYNEAKMLPLSAPVLRGEVAALIEAGRILPDSRILFVDDGSRDSTWEVIAGLCAGDPLFAGVKLSRNRGQQNALWAGLSVAAERAELILTLDADLQDDPAVLPQLLDAAEAGAEVVYGVRSDRSSDSAFKRDSAGLFYKAMGWLGVELVANCPDFRLMSRRAVRELLSFEERNLFLRGMVPLIGLPSARVEYARGVRAAGESKYPLRKMLAFAWEGVTSLSTVPLRLIVWLGALILFAGCAGLCWALVTALRGAPLSPEALWGLSLWALGGVQLCCLGVVAQYLGKAYLELKRRPRFIIERMIVK